MRTAANTPVTYYMDTPNAKKDCEDDRKDIVKKCKPEPPQSDDDEKKGTPRRKKGGLSGALANAAGALDDAGKTLHGYKRDKRSVTGIDGNGWMEDHCTGQWFTPKDAFDPELEKKLGELFEQLEDGGLGLLKDAFEELLDIAMEQAGDAAKSKVRWLAARTGLKGVVGVLGGPETFGGLTALMAAWTAYDVLSTAAELAELAGTKGRAAYEAMKDIHNIEERGKALLESYKNNPHKAQADAMALMAKMDPCLRARKCALVPFKNTKGSPAKHGNGCCTGQTGHHVLPDAMVDGAGCSGYSYNDAPVICLEGWKNGFAHGSHGAAHGALADAMSDRKKNGGGPTLPYEEAKKMAVDAIGEAGAGHCTRKCLEAQLDEHYGGCKDKMLNANAGTGGGVPKPPQVPKGPATSE